MSVAAIAIAGTACLATAGRAWVRWRGPRGEVGRWIAASELREVEPRRWLGEYDERLVELRWSPRRSAVMLNLWPPLDLGIYISNDSPHNKRMWVCNVGGGVTCHAVDAARTMHLMVPEVRDKVLHLMGHCFSLSVSDAHVVMSIANDKLRPALGAASELIAAIEQARLNVPVRNEMANVFPLWQRAAARHQLVATTTPMALLGQLGGYAVIANVCPSNRSVDAWGIEVTVTFGRPLTEATFFMHLAGDESDSPWATNFEPDVSTDGHISVETYISLRRLSTKCSGQIALSRNSLWLRTPLFPDAETLVATMRELADLAHDIQHSWPRVGPDRGYRGSSVA